MSDYRSEPQRLFESAEAPPGLRSLLVRAHEDLPSLAERELLVRAATTGWGTAAQGAVQGRALAVRWAARAARHSTKLLAMAAVVGVGAGALYVSGRQETQAPRASMPMPMPAAPLAVEEDKAVVGTEEPGEAPGRVEEPAVSGSIAAGQAPAVGPRPLVRLRPATRVHPPRGALLAKIAPEMRARSTHNASTGSGLQPASEPSPVQRHDAEEAGSTPQARPSAAEDKPLEVPATARAEPLPPQEKARASLSGSEEATLLRSARQALARSPERTLSLTDEHLRLFPRGILDQEREALAIEALVNLGRIEQARARAQAFERAYRDSPHRARIERAFVRVPGGFAAP